MAEKARANSVSNCNFPDFRTKRKRPARIGLRAGAAVLGPAGMESGSILYRQPRGRACVPGAIQREIREAGGWANPVWWALAGAKALSGCWGSSAPLLVLARRRAGPRGCRYGEDPGSESTAWDLGRGRARWASPPAHSRPPSWLGNRPWFCI